MIKPLAMLPLGDSAVLIQLGQVISESVHRQVHAAVQYIENHPFPGYIECIPSFTTVSIHYDLLKLPRRDGASSSFEVVCTLLNELLSEIELQEERGPVVVDIPVCYEEEYGPDLEVVATINGLTPEEVIHIHTGQDYLIYALGFTPGFPYVGGVSEQISAPRKSTPRLKVPSGSVGIAGNQTGIYPIETPGGWQIIGRTPLALFLPEQYPPTLLEGGQYIRFRKIDREEFAFLKGGSV
ncbi:5-oxoprolinase subunit PxpB [Paenibacillus sp. N3/727]|uniref:5-oxoprolinase subunit PxpB n=1 Tax=Paenibacillus sp. N3/727 TaxID=2925845 RepID=UPI001F531E3A|nr:5-oxoprolinase subunit PxpB [Paenibacillus sp. N3/727]UNK16418.1 5-oxoprolinase subunit PxpB [Paenibacillus sp. N3/727]